MWYPALYHQRPNSRRGRRRLGDIHGHEAKSYLVIGHLRGEGSPMPLGLLRNKPSE